MRKFTELFEKKVIQPADGFNKKTIEELLKKNGEVDIINLKGDRFFIPPFLHQKGKLSNANDIALTALTTSGKQVEVLYADIKTIEY
jgi:hypothetical protein